MEETKLLLEVMRVNTKAMNASLKVVKKLGLKKRILESFTETEKETERKIFQLTYALDYLIFSYKYVCNDQVLESRAAVEKALLVMCKEIEKLLET